MSYVGGGNSLLQRSIPMRIHVRAALLAITVSAVAIPAFATGGDSGSSSAGEAVLPGARPQAAARQEDQALAGEVRVGRITEARPAPVAADPRLEEHREVEAVPARRAQAPARAGRGAGVQAVRAVHRAARAELIVAAAPGAAAQEGAGSGSGSGSSSGSSGSGSSGSGSSGSGTSGSGGGSGSGGMTGSGSGGSSAGHIL